LTLPVNAGPGTAGLQNGAQATPTHTARNSAFGLPPALRNVPPA
jgi:hypothetical protein